jgi:hypothetical protein
VLPAAWWWPFLVVVWLAVPVGPPPPQLVSCLGAAQHRYDAVPFNADDARPQFVPAHQPRGTPSPDGFGGNACPPQTTLGRRRLSFPVFYFIDFALGIQNLASRSTVRSASCSYAAMGARENFDSVSRIEFAH